MVLAFPVVDVEERHIRTVDFGLEGYSGVDVSSSVSVALLGDQVLRDRIAFVEGVVYFFLR